MITLPILLFDLTSTQANPDGAYHGGGKYAKKVFLSLITRINNEMNWIIMGMYDSNKILDEVILDCVTKSKIQLIDISQNTVSSVAKAHGIRRFYTSLPFGLIKYGFWDFCKEGFEVYTTVHGLRTLETNFPLSSLSYLTSPKEKLMALAKSIFDKWIFRREKAKHERQIKLTNIIVVSEHTKYSVLANFAEIKIDIPVFYSPDVSDFDEEKNEEYQVDESFYFFMVSGNRWLKNNLIAATALDILFTERPEIKHKVIITGVKDPSIYLNKIVNKNRFVFHNYVSEAQLRNLYKNAYAFIYLSLNEGFGYPPLEAMRFGKPVIASPYTSIPEICGDAVLYSNPSSTVEIKNRILQVLDKGIYSTLSVKSHKRYEFITQKQDLDLRKFVDYLLS